MPKIYYPVTLFVLLLLTALFPYNFCAAEASSAFDGPSEEEEEVSPKNLSTRIVGGEDAPLDDYPWFARLVYRNFDWAGCGGMLVAPQYVLTAAHCVSPKTNWNVDVAAVEIGAVCSGVGSNNCDQPLQRIYVEKIIPHPEYDDNTANDDFALVKLVSHADVDPVLM